MSLDQRFGQLVWEHVQETRGEGITHKTTYKRLKCFTAIPRIYPNQPPSLAISLTKSYQQPPFSATTTTFRLFFSFSFYCLTPLFFTFHWGAAIYILIYPICCQRIMTTRHDLDAILHFYGRHFLLQVTIRCPCSPRWSMLRYFRLALIFFL